MPDIDWDGFKNKLESGKVMTWKEFDSVLHVFPEQILNNLSCKFLLTRCKGTDFRDDELISLLLSQIIAYVLRKKEYSTIDYKSARDLYLRAKNAFVQTPNSGEVGELILFLFLEADGIIQLYSKMLLKTNQNMHFHGYDAVHLEIKNGFILHFGHSKVYTNFSSALSDLLNDVQQMNTNKSQRDIELNLASSQLDEDKFGDYAETIRKLLNPYFPDKAKYYEMTSAFIAANEDFCIKSPTNNEPSYDEFMRQEFSQIQSKISEQIQNAIAKRSSLAKERFNFYYLPLKNAEKFNTDFRSELAR